MKKKSSWKEKVAIIATVAILGGACAVSTWARVVMCILCMGGMPLVFLLVLPFWHLHSVRRGLQRRTREPWRVRLRGNDVEVTSGVKRWRLHVPEIARARLSSNSNWTESTMLVDALTLFDERGQQRLKIPTTATGFKGLVAILESRGITIEQTLVGAPAYLD